MLTRRSQSATTPETGSCERLQRRNSSCDCRFAYDNVLADVGPAATPTETDVQTIEMEILEAAKPSDDVDERSSYELSAAQASCWLRQIICDAADSTVSPTDEELEDANLEDNQQYGEAQAQLESLYAQFDCLSANSQSRVSEHLQPTQLRRLRSRQLAVSACFSVARSLNRQRRIQMSKDKSEIFERLQSCRERLDLVAKCAARLRRRQPARQQSNSSTIRQLGSEDLNDDFDSEDGSTAIDRDRRLVQDSAARARRNVDDLATVTVKAAATFRRLGRLLLVDCTDCLRYRAERLGQRGLEKSASEDEYDEVEIVFEDAEGERLLARVESHLDEAAGGIDRLTSLQHRRLRHTLDEFELAQLLLNFAKDLCSDECDSALLNASGSDDNDVKSMISSSSSADSLCHIGETASNWLHRKERLEQLDSRLSVARKSLNQVIFLTRARLTIRRDLELRTVRLRHLRELAEADRRFEPTDFLAPDETEAIRPTTPELLATRSAKLEYLAKQIRAEFEYCPDAAKLAPMRLLDTDEALDRRRLEATEAAMQALRS